LDPSPGLGEAPGGPHRRDREALFLEERPLKLLIYDIEASGLVADFGTTLAIGYQWYGRQSVHVPSIADYNGVCEHCDRIKDPTNDKKLLQAIYPVFLEADAVVTWYGKGYDERFLNSRLIYHQLPVLPPIPHIDGWLTAFKRMKLHSNRLAAVQEFLELPDAKTPVKGPQWNRAKAGDRRAMRYVVDHCKSDVVVLREAYERLRPLIKEHPSRALADDRPWVCPTCGGDKLQKRGEQITRTRVYQRFQCKACGAWLRSSKSSRSAPVFSI
jgi:uncharacterized protein YprB with RNaseH-like and TPR domain